MKIATIFALLAVVCLTLLMPVPGVGTVNAATAMRLEETECWVSTLSGSYGPECSQVDYGYYGAYSGAGASGTVSDNAGYMTAGIGLNCWFAIVIEWDASPTYVEVKAKIGGTGTLIAYAFQEYGYPGVEWKHPSLIAEENYCTGYTMTDWGSWE